MATERQIAANRRNARKSTGPRSSAGKKRASANAYRHGLNVTSSGEVLSEIEQLARDLVGDSGNDLAIHEARTAAEAQVDVQRARRAKLRLIEQVMAFGGVEVLTAPSPSIRGLRSWSAPLQAMQSFHDIKDFPLGAEAPPLPENEPERSAEAVRRALPELIKLDRYEQRACARRDQALRSWRVYIEMQNLKL